MEYGSEREILVSLIPATGHPPGSDWSVTWEGVRAARMEREGLWWRSTAVRMLRKRGYSRHVRGCNSDSMNAWRGGPRGRPAAIVLYVSLYPVCKSSPLRMNPVRSCLLPSVTPASSLEPHPLGRPCSCGLRNVLQGQSLDALAGRGWAHTQLWFQLPHRAAQPPGP